LHNTVIVMFLFDSANLVFHAAFSIAGVRCHLSTNSQDVLQQAAPWQAAPQSVNTASFRMEVIEHSSLESNSSGGNHFRGLHHLVFARLEPRSFVTYDLLRRHVRGVVSSAAARDHFFWKTQLLPITMGVLGTTLDVAPLHCASLARDGDGILVAGVSGAGKSTLTAALACRGFGVVSDDWTYVTRNRSSLIANGLSAPIKLLPDSSRFFSELQTHAPRKTLNGEIAYELDPAQFRPGAGLSSCVPKWIFFLERIPAGGSRFLPCPRQYTRDFFESSAERLPEELRAAREARSEIIDQLSQRPSWFLRSGDDPHKTAEAIDKFLSEVPLATP
jgi:hypothetical protein